VDITADQFQEIEQKVVVTRESQWHRTFEAESRHIADYRIFSQPARGRLEAIVSEDFGGN
jgi:hypothetical protein